MIFLFPLLIIVFICLLIAKLAGATIGWTLVILPLAIVFILMLLFSLMGKSSGKKIAQEDKETHQKKETHTSKTEQNKDKPKVNTQKAKVKKPKDSEPSANPTGSDEEGSSAAPNDGNHF